MRIPRGMQSGARVSSIIVGTMLMLLAPGCGGDDVAGPGGETQPTLLFEDTFDGPTVSGAWMQSIFDCFADIDGAVGNPAPSLDLRIDPAATASGSGVMTTFQPFNSADGLTFTMLLFVDNPGRSGLNIDGASVTLIDQGRQNAARGGVGFHRNGLGGVTVSYAIYPGGPSSQISENIAL
ncbi:MAG: hypothetical protein O7F71_14355, partial [Gammaproteobacteria bacterium]|nr:hypothetical protein [Gammaproteobacteria bacterium]